MHIRLCSYVGIWLVSDQHTVYTTIHMTAHDLTHIDLAATGPSMGAYPIRVCHSIAFKIGN